MKKNVKQLISALLIFAVLMTSVSGFSLSVLAEDTFTTSSTSTASYSVKAESAKVSSVQENNGVVFVHAECNVRVTYPSMLKKPVSGSDYIKSIEAYYRKKGNLEWSLLGKRLCTSISNRSTIAVSAPANGLYEIRIRGTCTFNGKTTYTAYTAPKSYTLGTSRVYDVSYKNDLLRVYAQDSGIKKSDTLIGTILSPEEAAVQKAVIYASKGKNDLEKALLLHDWLCIVTKYDYNTYPKKNELASELSYQAYGALVRHTSVCAGYAKAYEILCNRIGLECKYVRGQVDGNGHAWNVVKIEGKWYHIDCTWDDGGSYTNTTTGDSVGNTYKYFLLSDSDLKKADTKRTWDSAKFPQISKTSYPDRSFKESIEKYTNNFTDINPVTEDIYSVSGSTSCGNELYQYNIIEGSFVTENHIIKEYGGYFTITKTDRITGKVTELFRGDREPNNYNNRYFGLKQYGSRLYFCKYSGIYSISVNGGDLKIVTEEKDLFNNKYGTDFRGIYMRNLEIINGVLKYEIVGLNDQNKFYRSARVLENKEIKLPKADKATALAFAATMPELKVGTTATATFTKAPHKDDYVYWKSSNPNVAMVDQRGVVTTIGKGLTYITASTFAYDNIVDVEPASLLLSVK